MAWNRHAIAQTQLRKHVASMAWGARNLIFHSGPDPIPRRLPQQVLLAVDDEEVVEVHDGVARALLEPSRASTGGRQVAHRRRPPLSREHARGVATLSAREFSGVLAHQVCGPALSPSLSGMKLRSPPVLAHQDAAERKRDKKRSGHSDDEEELLVSE